MENTKKETSVFEGFTNLYELSKTLRFELKPVGNTQKMLDEADVFRKDKVIKEKYQKTKPFIDRLHREFVEESFEGKSLIELKRYFDALESWKSNKKDKEVQKSLKKEEDRLRKEIVSFFDKTAKDWAEKKYADLGLKKKDIEILFEEGIFNVFKKRYGNEDESFLTDSNGVFLKDEKDERISIFDEWKGFVGYFTKFQQTRKNFYADDGTETAIATRIVDQNLKRFCYNLEDYLKEIKGKISDFSEIEKNFGKAIGDVFSLDFYNQCLLQKGIDAYNEILGGKTLDSGEKLRGINELVNEYRQKNKGEKLPFLKLLDKQIASEKEKFIIGIENDEKLFEILKDFFETAEEKTKILKNLFSDFVLYNEKYDLNKVYISKEALNTIIYKWVNDAHKFEECIFEIINKKENREWYDSFRKQKNDPKIGKDENGYKFPNFITLQHIQYGIEQNKEGKIWKEKYYKDEENKKDKGFLTGKESVFEQFLRIFDFEFNSLFKNEAQYFIDKEKNFDDEASKFSKIENILEIDKKERKITTEIGYDVFKEKLKQFLSSEEKINPESKIIIKSFADNVLWIYQMAKYFAVEKKRGWDDNYELDDFYTNPDFGYKKFYENAYEEIIKVYNDLRNYLTKKPYSEEKWKLNFENPTLANGWDKNKESDNSAVILRKKGKYYLGLMRKGNNKIFDDRNKSKFSEDDDGEKYEKIVYKYLPDAAKMIPKCTTQLKDVKNHFDNSRDDFFVSKSFIEPLRITKRIFDLNNIQYDKTDIKKIVIGEDKGTKMFQKEYYKLSNDFDSYKSALIDWIDFCKDFISKYESAKDFDVSSFKKTKDYDSLDKFYNDVAKITYKISFQDISKDYIDQKNQNGELYLFEIHNQDFAQGKTGTKNLHTLYFENLFSDENISKNFPIKLSGNAELFFRPKSIKAEKVKRKFLREIINKKRYTEDKVFFHCPVALNRGEEKITEKNKSYYSKKFNTEINNFLFDNKDINIIGIDRGEKHLAYYSVIDQSGKKIDGAGGSLNKVKGIEYASKLEKKANERESARRDWQTVEGIKDMKRGYISQIVRELADLAIEHNAIIVLEDLNMRFKQIRGGIEKSIYQQLEKALIDKLSFLVDKGEKDPEKAGHLLKAYQLCAPFESFKNMGKQTGILFYTQASYTSKTCPKCGFRKNNNKFYFEGNIEKVIDVLRKIKSFEYDEKNKYFNLRYCLSDFVSKEEIERSKKQKRDNALFSDVERKNEFNLTTKDAIRYRWHDKNTEKGKSFEFGESEYIEDGEKEEKNTKRGVVKKYDITKCLIGLFEGDEAKENGLNYKQNLLEKLISEKFNSKFYSRLFGYLNLIFEIRNSISGTEIDYIDCPECGFHTDKSDDIKNGDDNGAYNIARKGIMILEKIKQYKNKNDSLDKMGWGDLFIDMEEWDKFSQIVTVGKTPIWNPISKFQK